MLRAASRRLFLRDITWSCETAPYRSPDGLLVATTSWELKSPHLWNAESGKLIRTLSRDTKVRVYSAAFSRDGRQPIMISVYNTVRLWNVETGKESAVPQRACGFRSLCRLQPLWSTGRHGRLQTRPRASGTWKRALGLLFWTGIGAEVWSAAFSPDGARVIDKVRG